MLSVIDPETFEVESSFRVESAQDIAVIGPETAYLTRSESSQLLRLDLGSGATADVVDLGSFGGDDGNPDMASLVEFEGRLFIQLRRRNDLVGGFDTPTLAIVDLAAETLTGSIDLIGTAPRFKMQIVPETRRLFLSATGPARQADVADRCR